MLSSPLSFFFSPITATRPPVSGLDSQCLSGKGEDYRGRIAITKSGNACQHWNTQFPHKHGWIPDRYPCKYAEPHHCNKYQRTELFPMNPDAEARGAQVFLIYVVQLYSRCLSVLITPVKVLLFIFFCLPVQSQLFFSPVSSTSHCRAISSSLLLCQKSLGCVLAHFQCITLLKSDAPRTTYSNTSLSSKVRGAGFAEHLQYAGIAGTDLAYSSVV